ncbi:cell division protein ZipA [Parashewanella spongiae]|uniref:Cell division protein ZipA n=1 Tax=Parashewanella spongiae TaxID=342950 RepID=A0A3A6U2E9_9GAMM|nr:cell division protein ZipA [Parashewanella spongiae]MCL1077566.1 cell division protein ZipA [Parashewanella spongiae]RJY18190.1 cell division protein ZipA [Parashewanella spongiae]
MEDLRLIFGVLGGIAILGVMIHGIWSIRRQQMNNIKGQKKPHRKVLTKQVRDADGFDVDGISEVRVRSAQRARAEVQTESSIKETSVEPNIKTETQRRVEPALNADVMDEPAIIAKRDEPVMEPTQVGLFDNQELNAQELENPDVNEKSEITSEPSADSQNEASVEQPQDVEEELPDPYDVLVLHVMGKSGEMLKGAELLPSMLSMNFKFGEMDIFHRHQDASGNGKVLFSIANMVNPGVFDPDNMEQFSTQGVVMFMRLPCHGKALHNFSIMLNSAMQMADDLGATVMDGQREPWDEAKKLDYIRRIKS